MKLDKTLVESHATPYYLYDMELLQRTIDTALQARPDDNYEIHYAVKANSNPVILQKVSAAGLGADCVSIGEVRLAIANGFDPARIVFAGVAKGDDEIEAALDLGVGCLNVESQEELEVIQEIAARKGVVAPIALRVNPDIDAHTHHYITTGLAEDKFGIDRRMIDRSIRYCVEQPNLRLVGMHFHIGSQILTMEPFKILCERVNRFIDHYEAQGITFETIDVGGGLGIDYDDPDANPIADFKGYFDVLAHNLRLRPGQRLLCEPGRSLVAQCGTLISRVRYVKNGVNKKFAIIDAGMNDLIRPALYQAQHRIDKVYFDDKADTAADTYDVVGPICESADTFATDLRMPVLHRGDYVAIRSAGAYGETMASCYNTRPLPGAVYK